MSAQIVRFDDHHPAFGDLNNMPSSIGCQIYAGGVYLGGIATAPHIAAYDRWWEPLGVFTSLDEASAAILDASRDILKACQDAHASV